MHLIELVLVAIAGYLSIGIVFAIGFVVWGARVIDPHASSTSIGFKVLIIPGSALLWPILLFKWVRA